MITPAMQPTPDSKHLVRAAGWLALAVGATVLTGWALESAILKSLLPDGVVVKANTAFAFILIGVALLSPAFAPDTALTRGQARWAVLGRIAGLLAGMVGLLTTCENALNWNPGFDQWLFPEANAAGLTYPGRMAPETALCFMLLAAAIATAGARRPARWLLAMGVIVGLIVVVLAVAGILTHFTPDLGARGWWGQTVMAVPTAITFGILGLVVTRTALGRIGRFWHINRGTTLAFAGGLILLMTINLSLSRSQAQTTALARESRRHEALRAGYIRILAETSRAQSHTRSYVLTGEARFLSAHARADSACRDALATQDKLMAGTSEGPRDSIPAKVTAILQWFQRVTTLPRTADRDPLRREQVIHGEDLMDDLRQTIDQLERREQQALEAVQSATGRLGRKSFAIAAFGTLLSAGIFVGAAIGLNRAHRDRCLAHVALREANLLLEQRVHERTAELARHQQLLEQAGELARMGAWEVDLASQSVKWSAVVREIHEVAPDYVPTVGTGLGFYDPASRPLITAAVERAITHGEPWDLELQLLGARGSRPWVRTMGQPVREAGRIVRLIGMFQDITERRRAVEELQRQGEQLAAANRELEAFAYSVSHDLRAPLRGIDGFSRILLEDYADKFDEEGRDSVHRIRAATQRMAQLIDDMLNLSRITRSEMRREPVDLAAFARQILAELQRQEPARTAEITVADGLRAEGDPALLRVALENLLGNAWKFSARCDLARIEFGTDHADGDVNFFVRDNGAGFDPTYAGKLFGAFQRLHSTREFTGTGIGLATVQRIIRRHGGRVWADGQVGTGATFHFTLGANPPATPNPT